MSGENEATSSAEGNEITAELKPAELEREWEKLAERARSVHSIVKMGARTDLGRIRENNEDKFDFFEPEDPDVVANKGSFYAVADGMGGHAAGQIASELALKTVVKAYFADPSPDVAGSLQRAICEANALLYDAAQAIVERSGMGTTLTAVVIRADEAYFAHVGDSRAYLIRDGAIRQVTEDHSWVAEQVRRGALSPEEARFSPFRNVITRSLGNMPCVEADILAEGLQPGDLIILCSDGLSGSLADDEIRDLAVEKSPSQAAMDLVDAANDRGGTDNITAVVIAVKDIVGEDAQPTQTHKRKLFGLLR
jgi:serine/threonine protein phosphatase PrpC